MTGIRRLKTNFSKPYDWEDSKDLENAVDTALSIIEGRKTKKVTLTRKWIFGISKLSSFIFRRTT